MVRIALTNKQKEAYYKRKSETHLIIRAKAAKDKSVIYGARSINAQLPNHLDKYTEDYDIFSKKPKLRAKQLEQSLDKHYNGDYFRVQPAQHPGTYKVISNVTEREVADYTKQPKGVTVKKVGNVRYATLSWNEKQIKKTLKDKESAYRHKKDKEALQRIKLGRK